VNEGGQVVGGADTASGERHAFLWDPATGMTDLGTLGGNESFSDCVNERGQVAGVADTASGERHAFLWDPVSGMTDLGTLGGDVTSVSGPNDSGQVAGMSAGRAVLWTPVALAPQVRVEVAQAGYGNKLRVNVNPNRIGDAWKFRVQKRTAGVWTTLPTAYWTRGTAETRTLTLGPGRFRVKVANRYGYTGATSTAVRLTRKTARVHLGTDAARTRLRVDVDPNKGAGYWTFRVQRQRADGAWRTLRPTYTTYGRAETRTLNLRKGTYRVKVQAKYGYRGTTSSRVRILS
jgi:probable HAF family extracellular repeat protein